MSDQRAVVRMLAAGLVVLVAALLLLGYYEGWRSAGLRVGMVINELPSGFEVTEVEPGGPADKGGLRPGDRLVTVNGVAVSGHASYDAVATRFKPGAPAEFTVMRGDTPVTLTVIPGVPVDWQKLVGGTVAALVYLALALLVALQERQDIRTRLLFWFAGAVAIEMALPGLPVIGHEAVGALAALGFYVLSGVQLALELHLVTVLPEPPSWLRRWRLVVPCYYVIGLSLTVLLTLLYTGDFYGWPAATGDTSEIRSVIFTVMLPLWAALVLGILAHKSLTHPEPSGRHRAALVLLGNTPWALYIFATTAYEVAGTTSPAWFDQIEWFVLLCFPVAVFIAIFRYNLFDIEFVVRKSLIYATLTGTLLLVFYAAVGAGSVLFSQFISGAASMWLVAGATLILGLLFTPLRQALQGVIDRRFFPERHAMRTRLVSLAADLAALGKLPLMGRQLVDQLREIFGLQSATLLVADPKSGILLTLATTKTDLEENFGLSFLLSPDDAGLRLLKRTNRAVAAAHLIERSNSLAQRLSGFGVEVVAPVTSRGAVIGLLLLGPKETGARYSTEEMDLLNLFSHHVASVLENARLFASATFDSLTGLLRREAILDLLERELQRALRYHRPLTVGMADLDHFKETNDRYGHLIGDVLLNRVAQALQGGLRSTDAVGRFGGEEFLIVLPETDLAGARAVADKVRAIVEGIAVPAGEGQTVPVTVSIGLASLEHEGSGAAPTTTSMIAAADRQLYRAKRRGRNRIEPAA